MKKNLLIAGVIALAGVLFLVHYYLTRPIDDLSFQPAPDKRAAASRDDFRPAPFSAGQARPGQSGRTQPLLTGTTAPRTDKPEQAPAEGQEKDPEAEMEYYLNKEFEADALASFPLHTVQTHDPRHPEKFGPRKGEVWIRIKVQHSREFKDIMAQVADLYREVTWYDEPVTVMLWVGGHPWAKFQYQPSEEDGKNQPES